MSQFRLIILFIIAVFSLILTGYALNPVTPISELLILLALSGGGTAIVYGYDFAQLRRSGYNELVSNVLGSSLETLFFFLFVVVIAPLSFFYLSSFRIQIMLLICLCGLIYSMPVVIGEIRWKLKQVVFIKNLFIGFSWGALIIVGAGSLDKAETILFFLFVSLQVVAGSMIRDLSDVEKDRNDCVQTVPVKFGVRMTVIILHAINCLSFLPLLFLSYSNLILAMLLVVIWRMLIIWKVSRDHHQLHWTQTLNILTCLLIGIFVVLFSPNS